MLKEIITAQQQEESSEESIRALQDQFPSLRTSGATSAIEGMIEECGAGNVLSEGIFTFSTDEHGRSVPVDYHSLLLACIRTSESPEQVPSTLQLPWSLLQVWYLQHYQSPFVPMWYLGQQQGDLLTVTNGLPAGEGVFNTGVPLENLTSLDVLPVFMDLSSTRSPYKGNILNTVDQTLFHSERGITPFLPYPARSVDQFRAQVDVKGLNVTAVFFTVQPTGNFSNELILPFPTNELQTLLGREDFENLGIVVENGQVYRQTDGTNRVLWSNQEGEERVTYVLFDISEQLKLTNEQFGALFAIIVIAVISLAAAGFVIAKPDQKNRKLRSTEEEKVSPEQLIEIKTKLESLTTQLDAYNDGSSIFIFLEHILPTVIQLEGFVKKYPKQITSLQQKNERLSDAIKLCNSFSLGTIQSSNDYFNIQITTVLNGRSRSIAKKLFEQFGLFDHQDPKVSQTMTRIFELLFPVEVVGRYAEPILPSQSEMPFLFVSSAESSTARLTPNDASNRIAEMSDISFFERKSGKELVAFISQLLADESSVQKISEAIADKSFLSVVQQGTSTKVTYQGKGKSIVFSKEKSAEAIQVRVE